MHNERIFDELCNKVKYCTRCTRMEESARVLSRAAGPIDAPIMFIGEAPGRLGADASEIPFHGDKSGHNFEELLEYAGLDRSLVYISNAVLCNPKSETGNNSTPTKSEIHNCSGYLREQIELVNPLIVVSLGSVALEAMNVVSPHGLRLSEHVRTIHSWFGRKLIPLYHPGTRALIHRSMANQRSDYQFVSEQARRIGKKPIRVSGTTKQSVALVAKEIIRRSGQISYFGLHKLLYLIECEAARRLGRQATGAFFIRQKDGPYCTDLHILKLRKALPGLIVKHQGPHISLALDQRNDLFNDDPLAPETSEIVDDTVALFSSYSDSELKTRVYLTAPMKRILRIEKTHLINMYNSHIVFGDESEPHPVEVSTSTI